MTQLQPPFDDPARVAAEHQDLLAAIEAGDVAAAERRWRAHLDRAADNQIKALSDSGDAGDEEAVDG
jgi:DNA-binding GntR family transcriptional regulator